MRRNAARWVALFLLISAAGCQTVGPGQGSSPRQRRDLLTQEQIAETNQTDAYRVVESLRANWLLERGGDSLIGPPTKVQVYLDDTRMGGVEALRSINTAIVNYIQYFDGTAASARWGLGHGQGVIYVSTQAARQP